MNALSWLVALALCAGLLLAALTVLAAILVGARNEMDRGGDDDAG